MLGVRQKEPFRRLTADFSLTPDKWTDNDDEPNEPLHVHVDRDDLSAKFWLEPVGLARNSGFSPKELRRIQRLIVQHQARLLEAWHGHLGTGR